MYCCFFPEIHFLFASIWIRNKRNEGETTAHKFIRPALCSPKYFCSKLHDSSGLPNVKDRLLSCAPSPWIELPKSSSRKVDIFQQAQSRLGPFPDAIICGPSCKSLVGPWPALRGLATPQCLISIRNACGGGRCRYQFHLSSLLQMCGRAVCQSDPGQTRDRPDKPHKLSFYQF